MLPLLLALSEEGSLGGFGWMFPFTKFVHACTELGRGLSYSWESGHTERTWATNGNVQESANSLNDRYVCLTYKLVAT